MKNKPEDSDIITDSEEDGTPDEIEETDPREIIANKLTSEREENLEQTDNLNESLDLSQNDKQAGDDVNEEETDDGPETVIVKVDGEEQEITQEELVRGYQMSSTARKRLEDVSNLKKELDQGLSEVAKLKEDLAKAPLVEVPVPEQNFDLNDVTLKLREGSDEEATQAMEDLAGHFKSINTQPPVDVEAALDARFAAMEAKKAEEAEAALADEFAEAENSFNSTFSDELADNSDFFDLAAMEDRKLVQDPEWQGKPVEERLVEAGNRAKTWLTSVDTVQTLQKKQNKKERSVPRNGGSRSADIGKDDKPPTRSSVIAEMREARGQFL